MHGLGYASGKKGSRRPMVQNAASVGFRTIMALTCVYIVEALHCCLGQIYLDQHVFVLNTHSIAVDAQKHNLTNS